MGHAFHKEAHPMELPSAVFHHWFHLQLHSRDNVVNAYYFKGPGFECQGKLIEIPGKYLKQISNCFLSRKKKGLISIRIQAHPTIFLPCENNVNLLCGGSD